MIAVITGSGFYDLDPLDQQRRELVPTEWGEVSVTYATWNGTPLLFLPRHGADHSVPPHGINYAANLCALKALGATAIVATAVSGSMVDQIGAGDLVIIDDLIDFTQGRQQTIFSAFDELHHVDMSDPYDVGLRAELLLACKAAGATVHEGGTYCATNGPRFETKAEIAMMAAAGGHVVGMTGSPEVVFANELGIPYAALGVVVNHAAGLVGQPLSVPEIMAVLEDLTPVVEQVLGTFIDAHSAERGSTS